MLSEVEAQITPEELKQLQGKVDDIHVSDALLDYAQALVRHSRNSPLFEVGLSPRAAIALVQCAQAWAMLDGRDGVLPEDVQAVTAGVVSHRLRAADHDGPISADEIAGQLIENVPIP